MEQQIEQRVQAFVDDITKLTRELAIAAVKGALDYGAVASDPVGTTTTKVSSSPQASKRPGAKRDPKVLAKLVEQTAAYIKKNSGQGIEAIAKGMGVRTSELNLPVTKLLSGKRITKKGHKRATRYYAKA